MSRPAIINLKIAKESEVTRKTVEVLEKGEVVAIFFPQLAPIKAKCPENVTHEDIKGVLARIGRIKVN